MTEGAENESMDAETMESALAQYDRSANIRKGAEVTGKIVGQVDNGWLVDVGFKCEGFLPVKEWTHRILVGDAEAPKKGEDVTVQVLSFKEGDEAQLLVSRWRGELDRRWNELEKLLAENEFVKVRGLRKVKGGLMVEICGLEAFVPLSHLLGENRGGNPGKFVDQEFDVKLMEKDRRKHRIVFSRKALIETEEKEAREQFYATVKEGDVMEGEVSSLMSFGVFVNLGPIDGLVHMTELSWKRNTKLKDAYKKGDKVTVKVIGIDQENNRISLSIRQMSGDPWETVGEKWKVGMIVKGPVTNVTDFGAFVELEPGIEGLIHIGDISWQRIKHPKEVFRKGQEVEVEILEIDTNRRRISLGYKQLNDPWRKAAENYRKGQDINVKVVRLADFGAFVELEEGIEGLIHISQFSVKRVEKPQDVLSEGQEVVARIIEVNPEQRRMRLSIREIEEEAQGGRKSDEERKPRAPRSERREQSAPSYTHQEDEPTMTIGDILKAQRMDENE